MAEITSLFSFSLTFTFISCALVFCPHECLCKGVGSPGTVITESCEQPCRCWESNVGPLEEQPVLLITKPSLRPLIHLV